YKWQKSPQENTTQATKSLPHRAFEMEEVKTMIVRRIRSWEDNHSTGPNALTKWDKTKRLIKEESILIREGYVRERGKTLKLAKVRREKAERRLLNTPSTHYNRTRIYSKFIESNDQFLLSIAKDQESRKERTTTKWIRISGKPDKDFLAKPRGGR